MDKQQEEEIGVDIPSRERMDFEKFEVELVAKKDRHIIHLFPKEDEKIDDGIKNRDHSAHIHAGGDTGHGRFHDPAVNDAIGKGVSQLIDGAESHIAGNQNQPLIGLEIGYKAVNDHFTII